MTTALTVEAASRWWKSEGLRKNKLGRRPGAPPRVILIGSIAYAIVSNFLLMTRGKAAKPGARPYIERPSIYTPAALASNPHLGWQPARSADPAGPDANESVPFSWRQCFDGNGVGAQRPPGDGTAKPLRCRERPADLGRVPFANDTWVPNVTAVRAMAQYGVDRYGNPFPPLLSRELCEDMDNDGGKKPGGGHQIPGDEAHVRWDVVDGNKHCLREAKIRPTGALASDVVTVSLWNHYGSKWDIYDTNATVTLPAPRVLCMVYTTEASHAGPLRAVRDTWAGGCDGFLAFSTQSDPRIPAIRIGHDGDESYGNMWQKVRAIWRYVADHYLDDFDWFYLGGDDLFVLPHNLRTYLASLALKDGSDPRRREYFVGKRERYRNAMRSQMYGQRRGDGFGLTGYFNNGGAGYALSRAALRQFRGVVDSKECEPQKRTSAEDTMMSKCLAKHGIGVTDTRDREGRERFHFWRPEARFHWDPRTPTWYGDAQREWGLKNGTDCCAPDSVSFHYVNQPSLARHLQALLYHCEGDGR